MPLTDQTTEVSGELETEAENETVLPSKTDPELGVTLTVMEGGGGGGGATEPAPPPPQPRVHALAVRRTAAKSNSCRVEECAVHILLAWRVCGEGRMRNGVMQEKDQREFCFCGGACRSSIAQKIFVRFFNGISYRVDAVAPAWSSERVALRRAGSAVPM